VLLDQHGLYAKRKSVKNGQGWKRYNEKIPGGFATLLKAPFDFGFVLEGLYFVIE